MGILKHSVLGDVFGKIGHIVIKQRGKITYLSSDSKDYTLPMDERSIFIRNRFGLNSNFARVINSAPFIKQIWKTKFPDCYTVYHKILSLNFPRFRSGILTGTPYLTPDGGFPLNSPSVEISNNELIISSGPLSPASEINLDRELYIVPVSVFMIDTTNDNKPPITFLSRSGNKVLLDLDSSLRLSINLNSGVYVIQEGCKLLKSWSVLITLDKNNNPVHYSELLS